MKLRRSRGPNCCDAVVRPTMVMEKVRAATVIMEPAMVERSARAPSGPPPKIQLGMVPAVPPSCLSIQGIKNARPTATITKAAGKNQ